MIAILAALLAAVVAEENPAAPGLEPSHVLVQRLAAAFAAKGPDFHPNTPARHSWPAALHQPPVVRHGREIVQGSRKIGRTPDTRRGTAIEIAGKSEHNTLSVCGD